MGKREKEEIESIRASKKESGQIDRVVKRKGERERYSRD